MRKLVHLGLLAAFGLLATGCAITNYPVVTDTWERQTPQSSVGPVNTDGDALIAEDTQFITYVDFVDPRIEDVDIELTTYVEQDADGNQTLRTKGNVTSYFGLQFNDHLYCTPDSGSCAIWTAPNPVVGDVDPFDGQFHGTCFPLQYALQYLVWWDVRQTRGECGKNLRLFPWLEGTGLSDRDFFTLLERATPIVGGEDEEFLRLDLNKDTLTQFQLEAAGSVYRVEIPDDGSFTILVDPARPTFKVFLDRKGWPVFEAYLDAYDRVVAENPPGTEVVVQAELYGIQFRTPTTMHMALNPELDTDMLRTDIGGVGRAEEPVRTRADRRAR